MQISRLFDQLTNAPKCDVSHACKAALAPLTPVVLRGEFPLIEQKHKTHTSDDTSANYSNESYDEIIQSRRFPT